MEADLSREEIRRALYENVAKGHMEIVGEKDGEVLFRLTDQGIAAVRAMGGDPDPGPEGVERG